MNYAVEMGSSVLIYIPTFMKTDSGVRKLKRGEHIQPYRHTHTYRQHGNLINVLLFFLSK
jgi:hypothetical protein